MGHREIVSGAPMRFWNKALEHPCVGNPPNGAPANYLVTANDGGFTSSNL